MSNQTSNPDFRKRLKNYALGSTALLALGNLVSGQVSYSGLRDIIITDPSTPLMVDIDDDGIDEFHIGLSLGSGLINPIYSFNLAFITNAGTSSIYRDSWLASSKLFVRDIATDDQIDAADASWQNGLSSPYLYNLGGIGSTSTQAYGELPGKGVCFVGIRFYISSELHYGWMRLEIPEDVTQIRVLDWAYEMTPGTAITASLDTEGPIISMTSTVTGSTTGINQTITVTANEDLIEFGLDDLNFHNCIANSIVELVPNRSWEISVSASSEGLVGAELSETVVQDRFLNYNTESLAVEWNFDLTPPVASLSSSSADPTNEATKSVLVNFSETITDLDISDFVINNGSADNLMTISPGRTYTLTVDHIADGEVTVELPSFSVLDEAGNTNEAASFSWLYDNSGPVIDLTTGLELTNQSMITIEISADENMFNLVLEDILVTNGTASNLYDPELGKFSSGADFYTLDITPATEGEVSIEIPAGATEDFLGNLNLQTSTSFIYDTTGPTAVLETGLNGTSQDEILSLSVSFEEAIDGLEASDFIVSNGTANNLIEIEAGKTFTLDITAISSGEVIIELPAGVVTDNAGNKNSASSTSYIYDPINTIPNTEASKFDVYPNPANDYINLEFDHFVTVKIASLSGNIIIMKEGIISGQIDISSLHPGVYLICIESSKSNLIQQFIKE